MVVAKSILCVVGAATGAVVVSVSRVDPLTDFFEECVKFDPPVTDPIPTSKVNDFLAKLPSHCVYDLTTELVGELDAAAICGSSFEVTDYLRDFPGSSFMTGSHSGSFGIHISGCAPVAGVTRLYSSDWKRCPSPAEVTLDDGYRDLPRDASGLALYNTSILFGYVKPYLTVVSDDSACSKIASVETGVPTGESVHNGVRVVGTSDEGSRLAAWRTQYYFLTGGLEPCHETCSMPPGGGLESITQCQQQSELSCSFYAYLSLHGRLPGDRMCETETASRESFSLKDLATPAVVTNTSKFTFEHSALILHLNQPLTEDCVFRATLSTDGCAFQETMLQPFKLPAAKGQQKVPIVLRTLESAQFTANSALKISAEPSLAQCGDGVSNVTYTVVATYRFDGVVPRPEPSNAVTTVAALCISAIAVLFAMQVL